MGKQLTIVYNIDTREPLAAYLDADRQAYEKNLPCYRLLYPEALFVTQITELTTVEGLADELHAAWTKDQKVTA